MEAAFETLFGSIKKEGKPDGKDPQRIDVLNYLGLEHTEYQNDLYSFALSKPSAYNTMRTKIVKIVKDQALQKLHSQFYDLLKYGKVGGTSVIVYNGIAHEPAMPEHLINNFCLGVCKSMEKVINEALGKILQKDAEAILQARYAQEGAKSPDAPPAPAT